MPNERTLTWNDVAHLGPEEMERLWKEGRLNHLLSDVDIKRSKDGKLTHFTYVANDYSKEYG